MNVRGFPRPAVTADVAFLYEGFQRGELCIQVCDRCGLHRHPPGPVCPSCHSPDWIARPTSRRGHVHSYTVHHHPPIPPFETPHAVVLVDMEEGFRFLAALRGVPLDAIRIGMPVEARLAEVEPGFRLPVFHPADGFGP